HNIKNFPKIDDMEKLETLRIECEYTKFEIPTIKSDMDNLHPNKRPLGGCQPRQHQNKHPFIQLLLPAALNEHPYASRQPTKQPPSIAAAVRQHQPNTSNIAAAVRQHQPNSLNIAAAVRQHQPNSLNITAAVRQHQPNSPLVAANSGSQTNTPLVAAPARWRVEESDMDERVDRVTSNLFGFVGKIPPEKFSGGGRRWRVVVAGWAAAGGVVAARGVVEKRRVRESGVEGRIDRVTSNLFGFAGKIPPEKFSGGGRRRRLVAGRQEAAAGGLWLGWERNRWKCPITTLGIASMDTYLRDVAFEKH
nr:Toll/interleukin-1 receptor (TIR) domain-containing protein [Tanacetum cinerariifolium]